MDVDRRVLMKDCIAIISTSGVTQNIVEEYMEVGSIHAYIHTYIHIHTHIYTHIHTLSLILTRLQEKLTALGYKLYDDAVSEFAKAHTKNTAAGVYECTLKCVDLTQPCPS